MTYSCEEKNKEWMLGNLVLLMKKSFDGAPDIASVCYATVEVIHVAARVRAKILVRARTQSPSTSLHHPPSRSIEAVPKNPGTIGLQFEADQLSRSMLLFSPCHPLHPIKPFPFLLPPSPPVSLSPPSPFLALCHSPPESNSSPKPNPNGGSLALNQTQMEVRPLEYICVAGVSRVLCSI